MKTLTIELPEEEIKLLKQLLKKLNGRIVSPPNKETVEAMKELKENKGVKFNSVSELYKSV